MAGANSSTPFIRISRQQVRSNPQMELIAWTARTAERVSERVASGRGLPEEGRLA